LKKFVELSFTGIGVACHARELPLKYEY
jgi:hypothetical protein